MKVHAECRNHARIGFHSNVKLLVGKASLNLGRNSSIPRTELENNVVWLHVLLCDALFLMLHGHNVNHLPVFITKHLFLYMGSRCKGQKASDA